MGGDPGVGWPGEEEEEGGGGRGWQARGLQAL